MLVRFILSIITLYAYAQSTQAVDTHVYKLPDLYPHARQHDPIFNQAQGDWLSAQEQGPKALSRVLPSLNAQFGYSEFDSDIGGPFSNLSPSGRSDSQDFQVTLSQTIYNHGIWTGYNAAKSLVNSASFSFAHQEQQLILNLSSRYFSALSAIDGYRLSFSEETALKHQLQDVSALYEVGSTAETAVKEAQAAYDLSVAERINAENRQRQALNNLYAIIVLPSRPAALKKKLPPLTLMHSSEDDWTNEALKHNPNLLAAEALLKARELEVKAQRSNHYPNLELNASHSRSDQSGGTVANITLNDRDRADTRVTLNLNIPLYSGGAINAEVRSAIAQKESAKATLAFTKRNVIQSSKQHFHNYHASQASANAFERALQSSESSLEAVKNGYEAGTRTIRDVLDAERAYIQAQGRLLQARYDMIQIYLSLYASAGQLNQTVLNNIKHLFQ